MRRQRIILSSREPKLLDVLPLIAAASLSHGTHGSTTIRHPRSVELLNQWGRHGRQPGQFNGCATSRSTPRATSTPRRSVRPPRAELQAPELIRPGCPPYPQPCHRRLVPEQCPFTDGYLQKFAQVRDAGHRGVIDGSCVSACALALENVWTSLACANELYSFRATTPQYSRSLSMDVFAIETACRAGR